MAHFHWNTQLVFGIQHSDYKFPGWVKKWSACSTLIYLYHVIFMNISEHLCGKFRYDYTLLRTNVFFPFSIYLAVTLFALFVNAVLSRIRKTTS